MRHFTQLRRQAKAAKELQIQKLLRLLFSDNDIQELVIELNTENQLLEKGIDSQGKSLVSIGGAYAFATVAIKKRKGQETDFVTLKDTGAFYESFEVVPGKTSFTIEANTFKQGVDLQDRWGEDIVGLTEQSRDILIFNLIPLLISEIEKAILN